MPRNGHSQARSSSWGLLAAGLGLGFLGAPPSVPSQIQVSPLPEAISMLCNFPGAW